MIHGGRSNEMNVELLRTRRKRFFRTKFSHLRASSSYIGAGYPENSQSEYMEMKARHPTRRMQRTVRLKPPLIFDVTKQMKIIISRLPQSERYPCVPHDIKSSFGGAELWFVGFSRRNSLPQLHTHFSKQFAGAHNLSLLSFTQFGDRLMFE